MILAAAGAAKAQIIPFDACGTLVEGVECLLFHSDNSGTYLLDNYDGFGVGDRVHVTGRVDSSCVSICMEGNGCIWDNTIAECESPSPCPRPCHADPDCDGIHSDVRAVVGTVDAAFRGSVPSADSSMPRERTDVNCDGLTTILDVVKVVNVAFRATDPGIEYCQPCGPRGRLVWSSTCKTDRVAAALAGAPFGTRIASNTHMTAQGLCSWGTRMPASIAAPICSRPKFQISPGTASPSMSRSGSLTPATASAFSICTNQITNLPPGVYTIRVNEPYLWEGPELRVYR